MKNTHKSPHSSYYSVKNDFVLLFFVMLSVACSPEADNIAGDTNSHPGHLTYTDPTTGITWLQENNILGGRTDYNTAMRRIAELGDGFRAPDLREFLISFDYDHPDHVLSYLPIDIGRREGFYHTVHLRQDGFTLDVRSDNGDVSKWLPADRTAFPAAVYGKLKIKEPTFYDRRNGTIEIPEARLYALKHHVDCFGTLTPKAAITRVAQLQDGMCGLRDGSRPGDWRLPTMNELALLLGNVDRGGGNDTHALPEEIFPKRGIWYGSSNHDADGNFWNLYLRDHPMGYLGDAGADEPGIAVWVLAVRESLS